MICHTRPVPLSFKTLDITGTAQDFAIPAPPSGQCICVWGVYVAIPASNTLSFLDGSTEVFGPAPATSFQVPTPMSHIAGQRVAQAPFVEGSADAQVHLHYGASIASGGVIYYSYEDVVPTT